MFTIRFLFLLMSTVFVLACQTSPVKDFEQVQLGMDKNKVLHLVGSPTSSMRFGSKDRWIYRMYEDDVRYIKEIHFLDDKAVYVGEEPTVPEERQAQVIDRKNAEEEVRIAEHEVQKKADLEKSYDDYQKRSKLNDKVRYLPTFQPIK